MTRLSGTELTRFSMKMVWPAILRPLTVTHLNLSSWQGKDGTGQAFTVKSLRFFILGLQTTSLYFFSSLFFLFSLMDAPKHKNISNYFTSLSLCISQDKITLFNQSSKSSGNSVVSTKRRSIFFFHFYILFLITSLMGIVF